MTGQTPAYAYGRVLGELQRAVIQMFTDIGAGMADALARAHPPTPMSELELHELRAERRYQARIKAERARGQQYVRDIARQARRDLGLEERR